MKKKSSSIVFEVLQVKMNILVLGSNHFRNTFFSEIIIIKITGLSMPKPTLPLYSHQILLHLFFSIKRGGQLFH